MCFVEENLSKLKKFFEYNLEIKRILYGCAPNTLMDGYNTEYSLTYADKLYSSLEDIEFYMINIANSFFDDEYKKYVRALLAVFKDELVKCGSDFNKLKEFYKNCFSSIRPELADEVRQSCFAYYLFNPGFDLIKKTKTVNELLHVIHAAIVNNGNNYMNVPVLNTKTNDNGGSINLLGVQDEIAKKIYDNFPKELFSDRVDIMSFGKKILLLLRDVGHALSIEIDVEKDNCVVKYFIPKVCNYLMVNKLRGVTPVKRDSKYAVGEFVASFEEIPSKIIEFIMKVPTDRDMFILGGMQYIENEKNKYR